MAIFQISGPEGTENAQNRTLRGLAATRLATNEATSIHEAKNGKKRKKKKKRTNEKKYF
jgi:hypothetical protein